MQHCAENIEWRLQRRPAGNPPVFNGAQPCDSGRCFTADIHVGSLAVVSPEPFGCMILCLPDGFKGVLAQLFAANIAVVTLDIGTPLRLARLDVFKTDVPFLGLGHEPPTYIFWAVVDTNCPRLTAPLNDLVHTANDTFSGQRKSHLDAQLFSIEVIKHDQCSNRPTVRKLIIHEVHGPRMVWHLSHCQRFRFARLEALLGLDPQVQLQFAVDPVDAFVVPVVALQITQIQRAKAKVPGALVGRQPF